MKFRTSDLKNKLMAHWATVIPVFLDASVSWTTCNRNLKTHLRYRRWRELATLDKGPV